MKKTNLFVSFVIFAVSAIMLSSCGKESDIEYDKALLTGKWQEETLFEVYNADGTGYTWDEADDVKEEEAQKFTWTLEGDDLTQIHIMEMGASVPKTYVVTNLTETKLEYRDDFGNIHSFTKVKQ